MEELIPIPMFKLYGDLSQEVRRSTYLKFCEIPSGVLFCTDVAARGLDMPNISWIVQYDVPSDPKSYIHRIGRTARIGASGDALLFLLPSERPYVDILKTKLNMQFNDMSVDDIMAKLKVNLERNVNNDPLVEAASLQHLIESTVEESKEDDLKTMAAKAYQSFIRSYATHTKVTKEIFHVKNLHLGHVAKSFGLKDPPSVVGRAMSKQRKKIDGKKLVAKGVRKQKSQSIKKLNVLDEFAA
jgi:ATP-dependent RNA helicase DDX31/DBP7